MRTAAESKNNRIIIMPKSVSEIEIYSLFSLLLLSSCDVMCTENCNISVSFVINFIHFPSYYLTACLLTCFNEKRKDYFVCTSISVYELECEKQTSRYTHMLFLRQLNGIFYHHVLFSIYLHTFFSMTDDCVTYMLIYTNKYKSSSWWSVFKACIRSFIHLLSVKNDQSHR